MNEKIFIDTGYWLALLNKKDLNHKNAKAVLISLKKAHKFTSDFIIFETLTFLNASLKRNDLVKIFIDFVYSKDNIDIIEVNTDIKSAALGLMLKFDDKFFSFTDCTSFAIMNDYSIKNAYSFDNHFKQMGFKIL